MIDGMAIGLYSENGGELLKETKDIIANVANHVPT